MLYLEVQRRTPVGEAKISLYSSTTLSICFYCVEISRTKVVAVVVTTFRSPSDRIIKRNNLPVWEITFLHYFAKIKETALVRTHSSIL